MNDTLKSKEKTYTAKEIEDMLWIPCCHISGIHDPEHYQRREYICDIQTRKALERFCKELGINPKTKSINCGWCNDYPEKKDGEGLSLFKGDKE